MKAILQRVSSAQVQVNGATTGRIANGWLVLLGVGKNDHEEIGKQLAQKIIDLRLFNDDAGKFNLSLLDVKGEILLVSQFTLFADCSKGRRPSFQSAAEPQKAKDLYLAFGRFLEEKNLKVQYGEFGAHMEVSLVNDGPVTIVLDTEN